MKYNTKIGMEIHVELKTNSKMFCGCSAEHFRVKPNTHTCPVCLGLPGAMPVPNKRAIDWCIMIGLALGCKIRDRSTFDRKHYFYPDLAKGFQISQYDDPFCYEGEMGGVGVTRVHMEEDTGKLIHRDGVSLVDFNRSGVPLVEIVTEPDMSSAEEAVRFVKMLQRVVRYLEVSNGDMEKGSMRLEANISVNKDEGGYKVEVKNLNSFKFLEGAINYEIERQTKVLDEGGTPKQETRGYDADKGKTYPQRVKEEAEEYRYFPEPDIPPIIIENKEFDLPEMPWVKKERFMEWGVREDDAEELVKDKEEALYFEKAVGLGGVEPQDIANTIINKRIEGDLSPEELVSKMKEIEDSVMNDEEQLMGFVEKVLDSEPELVAEYEENEEVLGVLVGKVMGLTKGKADGALTKKLIKNRCTRL